KGVGEDGQTVSRARARTQAARCETDRSDPLGGSNDGTGHRRQGEGQVIGKADFKVRLYAVAVYTIAIVLMPIVEAGLQARLQTVAPLRAGHLFPPENLGLPESPDRAAWQKPDQTLAT